MSLKRTYFMWKEMVEDLDGDGEFYPMTPRDDAMVYEFPINFIFNTPEEAYTWLNKESEDLGIEAEESEEWVLVKYEETLMPQGVYSGN